MRHTLYDTQVNVLQGPALQLCEVYPSLGYEVCWLPKFNVAQRADFLLEALAT